MGLALSRYYRGDEPLWRRAWERIGVNQVRQTEQLVSLFEEYEIRLPGLSPNSPPIRFCKVVTQTARSLCDQAGALLIIDYRGKSYQYNLADVVVNSLTKYAGWKEM